MQKPLQRIWSQWKLLLRMIQHERCRDSPDIMKKPPEINNPLPFTKNYTTEQRFMNMEFDFSRGWRRSWKIATKKCKKPPYFATGGKYREFETVKGVAITMFATIHATTDALGSNAVGFTSMVANSTKCYLECYCQIFLFGCKCYPMLPGVLL